jgi:hypothetical protein
MKNKKTPLLRKVRERKYSRLSFFKEPEYHTTIGGRISQDGD